MKIHVFHTFKNGDRIELWYDRAYRCWFTARFDGDGNQIGECEDGYTRETVERIAHKGIDRWTALQTR